MEEKKGENAENQSESALFVNLIIMLSASAMQQMGKFPDPQTGKAEINMNGARISIDMLDMIRNKTRGNLPDAESKMLEDTISSLKLEFVRSGGGTESGAQPAPDPGDSKADSPADEKEQVEAKERKFHKTYGENQDDK